MSRRRSSMRSSDATAYSTRWRPCRFTARPRPPSDVRSPEAITRWEILARIKDAFVQRFNGRSPDLDSQAASPILPCPFREPRIDLHCGRHPRNEHHTLRHLIDVDAHWDTLCQAHPSEDRVDTGKTLPIGLRIRDIDAAGDAADMAAEDLAVAHRLNADVVADADRLE